MQLAPGCLEFLEDYGILFSFVLITILLTSFLGRCVSSYGGVHKSHVTGSACMDNEIIVKRELLQCVDSNTLLTTFVDGRHAILGP